jgi:hypothetical protein
MLCADTQELTRRKIVFYIALFPTAATALFILKLTKSRSIFYAKFERLCFHTASTRNRPPLMSHKPAEIGWQAGLAELPGR